MNILEKSNFEMELYEERFNVDQIAKYFKNQYQIPKQLTNWRAKVENNQYDYE